MNVNLIQYADLDDLLTAIPPNRVDEFGYQFVYCVQAMKQTEPGQHMVKNVTHGVAVRVIEPLPNGATILHAAFLPIKRYQLWPNDDGEKSDEAWSMTELKAGAIKRWIETAGGNVKPGVIWLEPNQLMFSSWRSESKE